MEKHIHRRDFSEEQENILGLDDPNIYNCRVHTYLQGHSQLLIALWNNNLVDRMEPQYYLSFDAVQYFEGFMWWKNANLCYRRHEIYINPTDGGNLIKHRMPMFVFVSGEITIKIWSSSGIYFTDFLPR